VDYASFFMSVGVIAAIVGNTVVHFIVRKYHKTWFVGKHAARAPGSSLAGWRAACGLAVKRW
jgi:hypothetical protein